MGVDPLRAGRPAYHMLVRSFAIGASEDDVNLVMWRWGDAHPAHVTVIDEQGRLTRPERGGRYIGHSADDMTTSSPVAS